MGGPDPEKSDSFDRWLRILAEEYRTGKITKSDLSLMHEAFGPALSLNTLQGFSLRKPYGYAGDFEIIDRMYTYHVSDDPSLQKWDLYFQAQSGPVAVRNRKAYFQRLVHALVQSCPDDKIPVLNLASGPARDIFEYFSTNGKDDRVSFVCVDADLDAIHYAKNICRDYLPRLTFAHANALRYCGDEPFKLIWSAGLFDYFEDRVFKFLLERLLGLLDEGGELVVGNFSEHNPTRNYMEMIGDWWLCHRDEETLVRLAMECGVDRKDIRIGKEPRGVNLFLHVKRGTDFIPMSS